MLYSNTYIYLFIFSERKHINNAVIHILSEGLGYYPLKQLHENILRISRGPSGFREHKLVNSYASSMVL